MRSSLPVLTLAWVLLVLSPALAQTSHDAPFAASAQYQYGGPGPGAGDDAGPLAAHDAMHDALMASDAIRATSEENQSTGDNDALAEESPSASGGPDAGSAGQGDTGAASEAPGANTPEIEKLPHTGGPSPLWLGLLLVCAGGLLARRAFLP
jgi:LPXTG-motif cell wall-anchored protein